MPPAPLLALSLLVESVHAALPDQEIYLVGGAVRDALLGQLSHDLDFVVPQKAIAIARRVADALNADFYILDESFDTARVIVHGAPSPHMEEENAARGKAEDGQNASRDFLDFSSFRRPKGLPVEAMAPENEGGGSEESAKGPTGVETDLRGRDFTINSIAYDLRTGSILDPLKGASDLRAKTLRACSSSSLSDDPIRILRGVRLAAALEFKIEDATRAAMKAAASRLPNVSPERQRDELFKALEGQRPDASLRVIEALGVFPYFLPELVAMKGVQQSAPHVDDVWEHTLSVMRHLDGIIATLSTTHTAEENNDLLTGLLSLRLGRYRERFAAHFANSLNPDRSMRGLLFLAALFHDVSKPGTRTADETGRIRFLGHEVTGAEVAARRARAFNLSNDEVGRIKAIVANHMRFHFHVSRLEAEKKPPSRRSIYRFFRDAGKAGVDLILLGLADLRGTRGRMLTQEVWSNGLEVARIFLENYWEKPEETVAPRRVLDGNEIMAEYKLRPGPIVGQLLAAIREAQAIGGISSRDEALAFGRKWLTKVRGETTSKVVRRDE